jgi:hypothetical protein
VRTWWEFRHLPNVLFVHFANLKRDMPREMRRIAEFLDVPIDETRWEEILEYCSFDWMKRNARKRVPLGAFWMPAPRSSSTKGPTAVGRGPLPRKTWQRTRRGPSRSSASNAPGG